MILHYFLGDDTIEEIDHLPTVIMLIINLKLNIIILKWAFCQIFYFCQIYIFWWYDIIVDVKLWVSITRISSYHSHNYLCKIMVYLTWIQSEFSANFLSKLGIEWTLVSSLFILERRLTKKIEKLVPRGRFNEKKLVKIKIWV